MRGVRGRQVLGRMRERLPRSLHPRQCGRGTLRHLLDVCLRQMAVFSVTSPEIKRLRVDFSTIIIITTMFSFIVKLMVINNKLKFKHKFWKFQERVRGIEATVLLRVVTTAASQLN